MEKIVREFLKKIGENPDREGLRETPARVSRAAKELYSGYNIDIKGLFKTFEDGACKEMVILKDIDFFSTCEHHILPFYGTVSIGYIPDKKVVGVSKLARLVEAYSCRLQIQERMAAQIADAMMQYLKPAGAIVIVKGKHLCMVARGVKKQNAIMETSAIRGVFKKQEVRNEFLQLIKG